MGNESSLILFLLIFINPNKQWEMFVGGRLLRGAQKSYILWDILSCKKLHNIDSFYGLALQDF